MQKLVAAFIFFLFSVPAMATVLLTGKVKTEVPSVLVYDGFSIDYADLCRETGVWEYYVDKSNDYRIYADYKYGAGEATSIMPQQKYFVGKGTHEVLDIKNEPVNYQVGEYSSDTQIIEFDSPSYIPDEQIKDRFFYIKVPENKDSFAGNVQNVNNQREVVADTQIRKIQLKDADDKLIAETETDACGRWHFMNVDKSSGNYQLCVDGYACKTISDPDTKISLNIWELRSLGGTTDAAETADVKATSESSSEEKSDNQSDTKEKSSDTKENDNKNSDASSPEAISEADSEAKIEELQKNADAMKKREQSTANKLLGGASIGAMGIGGMQVASALAEQNADSAAERDMTAYIATFKCDYGQSGMIQGGESNITLPGANVLLPIYNEYVTLATDLKARKEALGMSPGIESELVLDAATSGLYDNEGTGINGTYTSLYRALTDEDGEDAAAWAAQKSDTASQLKTGAITAGAGALVGVVGNILINEVGDKPKELSDEIIAKYDKKRTALRDEMKSVEKETKQEALSTPPEAEEGKENDNTSDSTQTRQAGRSSAEDDCVASGGSWNTESCKCPDGKKLVGTKCDTLNTAVSGEGGAARPAFSLYTDSLFDSGKTALKSTSELDKAIASIKENVGTDTDFKIVLVGHTDKDKIIQTSALCQTNNICTNELLSMERAKAVQEYIQKKWVDMPTTAKIATLGAGEDCASGVTKEAKALDRKVDFYVFYNGESAELIDKCAKAQD